MRSLNTIGIIGLLTLMSACGGGGDNGNTEQPETASVVEAPGLLWDVVQQNDENLGRLTLLDDDGDGIGNSDDNCPASRNASQTDIDHDGVGDACDNDIDGDNWDNNIDVCPTSFSATNVSPADDCPIECEGEPMPSTDNPGRGIVTERQMIAAILTKTVGVPPPPADLTAHVKAVFNAARNANNRTESWNNCEVQQSWYFSEWSGLLDNPLFNKGFGGPDSDAAIYSNAQRIIVSQVGTGASKGDLAVDIVGFNATEYPATGMKFHSGFYYHWMNSGYRSRIFDYAPNAGSGKTVYFTGHSLGGAASTVAMYDYVIRTNTTSKKLPQLYTFGAAPAVIRDTIGCSWHLSYPFRRCVSYRQKYEDTPVYGNGSQVRLGNLIYNYINTDPANNRNDPVPHLAPLYGHVGSHQRMDRREGAQGTYVLNSRIRSQDFKLNPLIAVTGLRKLREFVGWSGVKQHGMCFYSTSLGHAIGGTPEKWYAPEADRPECNN